MSNGTTPVAGIDINGGSIDGTPIGTTAPASIKATSLDILNATFALLTLDSTTATPIDRSIVIKTNGLNRWWISCSTDAETGANAGSNFSFLRWGDDGATLLGPGLAINRATGAVDIPGALSKGSGTFKIDHPLAPDDKILYHGFVEAPRYDLIYRGQAALVDGRAVVSIDAASNMTEGAWAALCKNAQVFVTNNQGWTAVRGRVANDGTLTIEAQDPACMDTVDWLVVAERDDPWIYQDETTGDDGSLVPEQPKPAGDLGRRIHPDAAALKQARQRDLEIRKGGE